MQIPKDLHNRITARYGTRLDLNANPEILQEIFATMWSEAGPDPVQAHAAAQSSPFGISWMDSWVAHWVVHEKALSAQARDAQFAAVLSGLVDLRFQARMAEIRLFIRNWGGVFDAPPDGGTPPPGVPWPPEPPAPPPPEPPAPPAPAPGPGPVIFFESPDGGPPEPGTPPAGPSRFEPPDGGPPEPGTPPTGPDAGFMRDNPWILYWFVSIQAPQILDMIDAHLTRRMNDIRGEAPR